MSDSSPSLSPASYGQPVDVWFYPAEIENDLKDVVTIPIHLIHETLACSWEYTRCVIPTFTNWNRYIAFTRIIIIGIIAEFDGALVDITASDLVLGYDLGHLFEILFTGTPGHIEMAQEYRAFLLITAEKSSRRQGSELFRRYVNVLAESPKTWFRLRDCDALVRFTIAAALACNDFDDVWFNEDQLQILAELGDTLYDAVAFYKHRAEGETNSTFAYVSSELRESAFRCCREILWALDVAWAKSPSHRVVINFLRPFGGPIHMMMRRYRFVEDGLVIGKPDTDHVVKQTRLHFKLWNRIDSTHEYHAESARYLDALGRSDRLMFTGLVGLLENAAEKCTHCQYRQSYGAEGVGGFGGVKLCDPCHEDWQTFVESFPQRASATFPEIAHFKVEFPGKRSGR
ncbi:hypothetical protein B0T25DRAFT_497092 [Lasiosphaeria hispida]|uniref:Aba 3 protein n=1 Tax=Lasiosphaeria hispida TaxID=260671 RepID=A0AAJ0HKL4_9PEZI|nr:hypothetical protein B0T25DRAFT_497092 [Lasiosphaeria hispida]